MEGRRGTRSTVTDQSLKGAPLPEGKGSRSDGSQSGAEGGGQESQSGKDPGQTATNRGNPAESQSSEEGGGGSQDGGQLSPTEQSSLGLTDDEAADYAAIKKQNAEYAKGKKHADRKIAQQGRQLSQAQEESQQFSDRFGKLEGTVNTLANAVNGIAEQLKGAGPTRSMDASYGNDFEFGEDGQQQGGGQEEGGNGDDPRFGQIQRVLGGLFKNQKSQQDAWTEFQAERTRDRDLSHLETGLGVERDVAETILDSFEAGDILGMAKVITYGTVPAEARKIAREQRQRQRSSVFQPATAGGGGDFNPSESDKAVLEERAQKILEMPDGINKVRATEDFLENYPGSFEVLKQLTGYNV